VHFKDPVDKICRKNGTDCSKGSLKFKFDIIPKTHFWLFVKNFRKPWMKFTLFAIFPILGFLWCQGWAVSVTPKKCDKMPKMLTLVSYRFVHGARLNFDDLTHYI